jgi:hypothetical protein
MNTAAVTERMISKDLAWSIATSESVPWYIWSCVTASFCIVLGLYWDISWHMSIGRDTFWTPAHMMIQSGAILAGLASAYMIFTTTFGNNSEAKQAAVKVLGFSGPLGAFICAWGAGAMLVSAPFDNWWHNAYGLDVKIISPPHQLLGLGIYSIDIGSVVLIAGAMSRASGQLRRNLEWLLLVVGGLLICELMMNRSDYIDRSLMHSAVMYLALSISLPLQMEWVAMASSLRWPRTAMASFYTIFFLLALWIFPLFPAAPKLGPVYQTVTHMVPLAFPVLLIAPAFAVDLLHPRMQNWGRWRQAAVIGILYITVLMAVQWPFADFLMSRLARNRVFGTQYFFYGMPSIAFIVRNEFFRFETTALQFWRNLGLAFALAILSTRIGITWGHWLHRVRR